MKAQCRELQGIKRGVVTVRGWWVGSVALKGTNRSVVQILMAWKLFHQTFLRLWSYSASSVFVVGLGTGQLQKSQMLRLGYTPRFFRSTHWHSPGITSSQGLLKLHPGQAPGAKGVRWHWRGARWVGSSGDVGTSKKVTVRCDSFSGYLGHSHRVFYPSIYTSL